MTDLKTLRNFAQSILSGVQRLEDFDNREDDEVKDTDIGNDLLREFQEVDSTLWGIVDWLEMGRPDD